jgi:sugar phosphate isomerase/epimerase
MVSTVTVFLALAISAGGLWCDAGGAAPDSLLPPNPLACRVANYGKYQEAAWSHLPSIGVHYVFMSVPAPGDVQKVQKRLADSRLSALVMRGDTDLGRAASVDELAVQLATCQKMGVRYMFLSPKHSGASKEVACERLRRAGDVARKHGVTIALETHPDLGTNADVHLETMKRIDHPNVRVNFDTGNITFYNKDRSAVEELKKIIHYVATVELKDHTGQYQTWNFPTLGQGVVDFPGVLRVLKEHRFRGPITMEVEGVAGAPMTEEQTKKYVADSVAYLKSLAEFR